MSSNGKTLKSRAAKLKGFTVFNEIHNHQMVFSFGIGKIYPESSCIFSFY